MSPITFRDGAARAAGDAVRSDCAPSDPPPSSPGPLASPSLGRVTLIVAGHLYWLRAEPPQPDEDSAVRLMPMCSSVPDILVSRKSDPDEGSTWPHCLGLTCSCDAYSPLGVPCAHIGTIATLWRALPAPALSWGEDPSLDDATVELGYGPRPTLTTKEVTGDA